MSAQFLRDWSTELYQIILGDIQVSSKFVLDIIYVASFQSIESKWKIRPNFVIFAPPPAKIRGEVGEMSDHRFFKGFSIKPKKTKIWTFEVFHVFFVKT